MKSPNSIHLPGVTGIEVSGNKKLGLCATTYVAQHPGCPPDCPFLGKGCYYEYGPIGIIARRMDAEAKEAELTPLALGRNEARVIDSLTGRLPLRLHSGGDCRTPGAVRAVSAASRRYRRRHHQPVFTYHHAWQTIARSDWGDVSVLASCETPEGVRKARARGYATAITVAAFPDGAKRFKLDGITVQPCPEQAGLPVDCSTCRLCMDDQALLKRNVTIGFSVHGSGAKHVQRALQLLNRG